MILRFFVFVNPLLKNNRTPFAVGDALDNRRELWYA